MGLHSLYPSKRKLLSLTVLAFVVGGTLGGILWNVGGVYTVYLGGRQLPLQRFSSYQELKTFLNQSSYAGNGYWLDERGFPTQGFSATVSPSGAKNENGLDYSTTNIQVEGVDEADIVKTDGEYIYLASGNRFVIAQATPPGDARVLYRLDMMQEIKGLYVNGDRLVLFLGSETSYWSLAASPATLIRVYDVANRSSPTLVRGLSVDGFYFDSRMIDSYVYVLVNKPAYLVNKEVQLPIIRYGNRVVEVAAESIYYLNATDYQYTFTNVVAIDIKNAAEEPRHETFMLGSTATTYVSQANIYITSRKGGDSTVIHKIGIDGGEISYVANGTVAGHVLNQFSMDESGGYFRVATTRGSAWSSVLSTSNVYVLNDDLRIVGRLEGLAPGESIYAARFMGERCYLVTFRKVDPLFVISLKDPTEPKVLGKLKIPGYSDYLHPYDENHLIGIGKETVAAEEGNWSWYQGVKISLFDVSNVSAPKEVSKFEIGDRGTDSPVLRDHKAFLFSREKGLLVIPILLAEVDPSKYPGEVSPTAYGQYVWQGAYVFAISEKGLTLRGRITHISDAKMLTEQGYGLDSPSMIERSLYIDDVLYTISDSMIKLNSLVDLREIDRVELS